MSKKKGGKSVLSKRYAQALFELAAEKKQVEKVEKDLASVLNIFEESKQLSKILKNPNIAKDELGKAIKEILKKAGATELTLKFANVLAENRRLNLLPDMARAFIEMAAESRGEVAVTVTAANSLKKDDLADIKAALDKTTGKKAVVTEVVDKNILGGLIIKAGSKMFDASIAGKLERLRLQLKR